MRIPCNFAKTIFRGTLRLYFIIIAFTQNAKISRPDISTYAGETGLYAEYEEEVVVAPEVPVP